MDRTVCNTELQIKKIKNQHSVLQTNVGNVKKKGYDYKYIEQTLQSSMDANDTEIKGLEKAINQLRMEHNRLSRQQTNHTEEIGALNDKLSTLQINKIKLRGKMDCKIKENEIAQ